MDILPSPFPWYLAGPLIGLSVVGLYMTTNKHLGVSGSYLSSLGAIRGRETVNNWRIWFLGGTILGAAIIAIFAGGPQRGLRYGALGEALSLPQLVVVLFLGSILIGYGARLAGGCTSGHGISGCATRSPGSFLAVGMFVMTAVVLTLGFDLIWGGR